MNVYLCGPITSLSYKNATSWREEIKNLLKDTKIHCINPLRFKEYLSKEESIQASYEHLVLSSGKGFTARDKFDVMNSDVILANFLGADKVSIGSVIEIAWAHLLNKPIVAILEKENMHNHPMLMELVPFKVSTLEEAAFVLEALQL